MCKNKVPQNDGGREIAGNRWFDSPPDFWTPEEKKLYDMLIETKQRMRNQIRAILAKQEVRQID